MTQGFAIVIRRKEKNNPHLISTRMNFLHLKNLVAILCVSEGVCVVSWCLEFIMDVHTVNWMSRGI